MLTNWSIMQTLGKNGLIINYNNRLIKLLINDYYIIISIDEIIDY